MSTALKPVLFFDENITILPHTASVTGTSTDAQFIDREISIGRFCNGQSCRLEQVEETGDYLITREDGAYIEGPER